MLECDDYSDMPARVFVRGYIRNYARTVGLPIDSILAQFDRLWPDEASTVHIHPEPRLAADTEPGNRWPNVVSWLVLQVADVLFPGFGIPETAIKALVWAAVLGFPLALIFG